nr:hypothetical protein [Agathobacter ruminis]
MKQILTLPMQSSLLDVNGIKTIIDGIRLMKPILNHNRPQYSLPNFHVSSFFIDLLVRYPIR